MPFNHKIFKVKIIKKSFYIFYLYVLPYLKKQINFQAFVREENFISHLLMLDNVFVNH